jgi:hypothetical protein
MFRCPPAGNKGIIRQHIPDDAICVVAGDGIVALGACGPDRVFGLSESMVRCEKKEE